ncbi:hypothetical protein CDA63_11725 [Hymenobacter amundsenii]|uniref:Uncharacterized protein n=1 Tax=Hymenobacter amundsenii TaxID=2006685 RepID=A0A246FJZ5_9BACT|nr:hypothetical protein [Hymenobacter amundsenii]OWP62880.1 hypothetical protein CDA63_11725 [Hymenobacter amundsenii]
MAKNKPIGFGREDEDPNGTGDGWRSDIGEQADKQEESSPPPRQPKADPVFVSTIEGLEILGAYGLMALGPLSNLEQQLLQVIAGLEKRIIELE